MPTEDAKESYTGSDAMARSLLAQLGLPLMASKHDGNIRPGPIIMAGQFPTAFSVAWQAPLINNQTANENDFVPFDNDWNDIMGSGKPSNGYFFFSSFSMQLLSTDAAPLSRDTLATLQRELILVLDRAGSKQYIKGVDFLTVNTSAAVALAGGTDAESERIWEMESPAEPQKGLFAVDVSSDQLYLARVARKDAVNITLPNVIPAIIRFDRAAVAKQGVGKDIYDYLIGPKSGNCGPGDASPKEAARVIGDIALTRKNLRKPLKAPRAI